MADKDIPGLLAPLLPLVDVWHCCSLPTARAATAAALAAAVQQALAQAALAKTQLGGVGGAAPVVHQHADPASALAAAAAAANPADRIIVYGSFYTVGGVLKEGLPRLDAPHVRAQQAQATPAPTPGPAAAG
jgi:dihydrofolate synthase / folylpolyglutamate synthase